LTAANAATDAGPAAVVVADALVAAVEPLTCGDGPDLDDARAALHALIGTGDPRWRALLIAAWQHASAHDDTATVVRRAGVTPDQDLVSAVQRRIEALDGPQPEGRIRFRRAASPRSEQAALRNLAKSWRTDDAQDERPT
jgi:hypothetical protein